MTLSEALKSAKGEKEAMTVSEFLNAVTGQQLDQYDKLFDAVASEDSCDFRLALDVLNSKSVFLREWINLSVSDNE